MDESKRNPDGSVEPHPGEQTFEADHRRRIFTLLAAATPIEDLEILYNASYSATFAADFRQIIRDVVRPEIVDQWEA